MMFSALFAVLALAASVLAQVYPGTVKGDTGTHDPSMCKDPSGTYFLFGVWQVLFHLFINLTSF